MERSVCRAAGLILVAAGLLWPIGCGGPADTSSPDRPGGSPPGGAGATGRSDADPRTESARTAEATLRAVAAGFREGRPIDIWQALPPSYQDDVNELLRSFGEQMDPELWDHLRDVAAGLADLLRERREWILAYPPLRDDPVFNAGPGQQLLSNWDMAVSLIEALATTDLETLRSFDGKTAFAAFNEEDLARLRRLSLLLPDDNPYSLLGELIAGAKVQELEAAGDRARIEIRPAEGQPRVFGFVRVEGRWFPESWHETWDVEVAETRRKLDAELAPGVLARKKQHLLPQLTAIGAAIDRLAIAGTEQEFHDRLDQEVLPVLSGAAAPAGDSASPESRSAPASRGTGRVTVQFARMLDERNEDAVAGALIGLADRADAIVLPVAGRSGTALELSPVADVEEFARRIRFGRVTQVDLERRTVHIELRDQPAVP